MAFVRNHYVGRSFLQPSQLIRDFNVRVKLNLITELVKGKRVIVVDDSIVRGTTCKARVNNLKEAGREGSPCAGQLPAAHEPVRLWNRFSRPQQVDGGQPFPGRNPASISTRIRWPILSEEGMVRATGLPKESFCMACYDGNYPVPYDPLVDKHIMERRRAHGAGPGRGTGARGIAGQAAVTKQPGNRVEVHRNRERRRNNGRSRR